MEIRITDAETAAIVVSSGNLVVVAPTGSVVTDTAIAASGSNASLRDYGFLSGTVNAIFFGRTDQVGSDTGEHVFVGTTGVLDGDTYGALVYGGGGAITNHGQIFGGSAGIEITAQAGVSATVISNFGAIDSALAGIEATGPVSLVNFGSITGSTYALALNDGNDTVVNHGTLVGRVYTGGGDDVFDNRGGTVKGAIYLGDGNDTFIAGADDVTVDGGIGTNTIDFSHAQGALVLALDGSLDAAGWAAGDTITGFGNVTGAAHFANTLVGDANANVLIGGSKADTLYGGGADSLGPGDALYGGGGPDQLWATGTAGLYGGAGADTLHVGAGHGFLSGGAGADKFVFDAGLVNGAGAGAIYSWEIADFSHADKDRIDLSAIDADTTTPGDQAFTWIGTAAFDGKPGELRSYDAKQWGTWHTYLVGDVNGDGQADFVLYFDTQQAFVPKDFVL